MGEKGARRRRAAKRVRSVPKVLDLLGSMMRLGGKVAVDGPVQRHLRCFDPPLCARMSETVSIPEITEEGEVRARPPVRASSSIFSLVTLPIGSQYVYGERPLGRPKEYHWAGDSTCRKARDPTIRRRPGSGPDWKNSCREGSAS